MDQYISAEEANLYHQKRKPHLISSKYVTFNYLIDKLVRQSHQLDNVETVSIDQQGNVEIAKPEYAGKFFANSLFVSSPVLDAVNSERGDLFRCS